MHHEYVVVEIPSCVTNRKERKGGKEEKVSQLQQQQQKKHAFMSQFRFQQLQKKTGVTVS